MLNSPKHQSPELKDQIATLLNIESDRIEIDDRSRLIIHCQSDAEILHLTNEWWKRLSSQFHDRISYFVLHKDNYQRTLPLNPKIWHCNVQSLSIVQPT